ncbi:MULTISPECIES: D-2-hydroxyacid dehydrogenase [unclassified Streptomyces]|uniref:D-2-hydroxyacid dehydrogenase n=1 Tax=unclassified Streptomyces TaxID=2593676 RepID=UPI002DD900A9|nr:MULTISPECIES: D-2-hydroxyacid dehydrogenase [unclassified Streptomyces]WSA94532.1 D-2-hydroxyacid dehydrogenase [Streptomyces sp. NBC_01795]WSB78952.1 D-2-hydroxyacid dehydrogenase [Streptomyces sp. NBC_01775]WSS12846.1 D-2-hydroxyacid dehydrogenase [Streptomyces sp. NBC_01186]WSS41630.1 D-2-hydroxyacid dehydrogenase [Streptomyces sp. NBC_01187]
MSETCVLVLDAEPLPQLDRLAGRARVVHADERTLAEELPAADVLLVWDFLSDAVREAWPGEGPRPRWVHTPSAGVDRLLPELADADETVITNARGIFDRPIAEYVLGLVLAMAKDFRGTWELQRQRRWRHRETFRLGGSRATVVGSGPIGREIGRALLALGVTVDLVGRTARDTDAEFGRVHSTGELPLLVGQADWVVCVAPLTNESTGMFDAGMFARMKPGAHFLNVGRGQHVVEDDLVDALLKHRIKGAALDVFAEEPLPADSRLWDVPGLLISPHMSGDTVGWRDDLAEQFLDNFDRWEKGEPLLNVVDKKLGYVPTKAPGPAS